jgi:type VI protein secretion system component Hcp
MAAASGQPFSTAVVEIVRVTNSASHVFLKLELFDVRVAAYSSAGRSQGEVPTEEVKLSYSRIHWTVSKFNPATGQPVQPPSVGGWDLVNNKAF